MKRNVSLTAVALTAFALAPLALAQSATPQGGKKGPDLLAFAQQQKAQPMPQMQTPSTPVEQAHGDAQQQQPAAARSFTGTIVKAGDVYVLKTSDNMTYQLDDQSRAKDFEGKQVQVTGSLDSGNNTIKVQDIKQAA